MRLVAEEHPGGGELAELAISRVRTPPGNREAAGGVFGAGDRGMAEREMSATLVALASAWAQTAPEAAPEPEWAEPAALSAPGEHREPAPPGARGSKRSPNVASEMADSWELAVLQAKTLARIEPQVAQAAGDVGHFRHELCVPVVLVVDRDGIGIELHLLSVDVNYHIEGIEPEC